MTQVLLPINTLLNNSRYRIDAVLGQGGFGVVYLATHQDLQTQVAIKAADQAAADARQAFLDEARLISRLRHPHLPRVTDYFIDAHHQQSCLVMDYIPGKDLDQLLSEHGGPLDETWVRRWLQQVLNALAYLHGQHPPIVHRDIKPGNLRIAQNGNLYLVDFGIAKVGGTGTQTKHTARAVSEPFSPLEQYGGPDRTDTFSDIYALGVTLYVLLTATLPPDPLARQAGQAVQSPRQINPLVTSQLEQIVLQALELTPNLRYQHAQEMQAALTGGGATSGGIRKNPCPRCGKQPITPGALFCHSCGSPILLVFPSLNRQLADPADLLATCDAAWYDAVKHVQNGSLLRWLEAHSQAQLAARLRQVQTRYASDSNAALEAFVRPSPPQHLEFDPSLLDFGACPPNAIRQQTVLIRRHQPGYIHGHISSEDPWLSAATQAIQLLPHVDHAIFQVRIDAAALVRADVQRSHTGGIVCETNHGSLRLPVQITISNPPRPRLYPPVIELGKVAATQLIGSTATLINEGGGSLSGTVHTENPWLTIEAQQAQFVLGDHQHATVNFQVAPEHFVSHGQQRGTLLWETNVGTFITEVQLEVTPPYAIDPGNTTTQIHQAIDLLKLCDVEPRNAINHWERGVRWLQSGRIEAALRFLGEDRLAYEAQKAGQLAETSVGLERVLRALGAKPAHTYQDNSREVIKQIVGWRSRKPTFIEYAILNTSRRGYLHGKVQPLVTWLHIPEPHFGCLPGEEAIVQLYPDYQHRCYGDLFETWIE